MLLVYCLLWGNSPVLVANIYPPRSLDTASKVSRRGGLQSDFIACSVLILVRKYGSDDKELPCGLISISSSSDVIIY